MKWRVVSYVNLSPHRDLWRATKIFQKQIVEYCNKIEPQEWYYLTDCRASLSYFQAKAKYIDQLKESLIDYTTLSKPERKRRSLRIKRGWIDFLGEGLHILTGIATDKEVELNNEHINKLEQNQAKFLHVASEEMTIIKTTISSINGTMDKVRQNEEMLKNRMIVMEKQTRDKLNKLEVASEQINMINEQIKIVLRGMEESQHSFELLLDAFVHAEQGSLQPQLLTLRTVRGIVSRQALPQGLDFPNFPISELSRLIVPHAYVYQLYLVYVIEIPLLLTTQFQLYKIIPFPVADPTQNENDPATQKYMFVVPQKELIFTDSMRKQFGKMNLKELEACHMVNELTHVCQDKILLSNYAPGEDCEASLLHPSSQIIPKEVCEIKMIALRHTYWIPLQQSNQWLYTSPTDEKVTVLCDDDIPVYVHAINRGKLSLKPRCKAYTAHVTLYASTKLTIVSNVSKDFLPDLRLDFDSCFGEHEKKKVNEIPLDIPLNNVMSSIDDLRLASVKVGEVRQLIKEQEQTDYSAYHKHIISTGLSIGTIVMLTVSICLCCCCCKCCRQCFFRFIKIWNPRRTFSDCVNGCREIKDSFNTHNTVIAVDSCHGTMSQRDKEDLTNTLTRSLLEIDQNDKIHFSHQARKLPSAPTSEEDLRNFIKQVQTEEGSTPLSQRLRKKKLDPGSHPLFDYRK
jgi:hypothetical protein